MISMKTFCVCIGDQRNSIPEISGPVYANVDQQVKLDRSSTLPVGASRSVNYYFHITSELRYLHGASKNLPSQCFVSYHTVHYSADRDPRTSALGSVWIRMQGVQLTPFAVFRSSGMTETDSLDAVSTHSREKKSSMLGRILGRKKV